LSSLSFSFFSSSLFLFFTSPFTYLLRVKSLQNFREPPPPPKKSESGDAEKSEKSPKE
jgi:hypothetical protein